MLAFLLALPALCVSQCIAAIRTPDIKMAHRLANFNAEAYAKLVAAASEQQKPVVSRSLSRRKSARRNARVPSTPDNYQGATPSLNLPTKVVEPPMLTEGVQAPCRDCCAAAHSRSCLDSALVNSCIGLIALPSVVLEGSPSHATSTSPLKTVF